MLRRVTKKPDDIMGLCAAIVTGEGSVSAIVDDRWGRFKRTGRFSGKFIIGPANEAIDREDLRISLVRPTKPGNAKLINQLRGTRWRPWRNCFSVLGPLWKTKS